MLSSTYDGFGESGGAMGASASAPGFGAASTTRFEPEAEWQRVQSAVRGPFSRVKKAFLSSVSTTAVGSTMMGAGGGGVGGPVKLSLQEQEYCRKLVQDIGLLSSRRMQLDKVVERLRGHRNDVRRHTAKEIILDQFEQTLRDAPGMGHGARCVDQRCWTDTLMSVWMQAVVERLAQAKARANRSAKAAAGGMGGGGGLAASAMQLGGTTLTTTDYQRLMAVPGGDMSAAAAKRPPQAQLDSLWRAFHGDFYAFANTVMEADVQTDVVNKFGFVNPGPCLAEEERPEMGRDWPYDRANSGERHGSSHVLKLAKVPRRIVYKMGTQKCLTAVQPPSLWDAKRDMRKSGKPPPIGLELEHVHGYCSHRNGRHVGRTLHFCKFKEDAERVDNHQVVFYAAATAVVMDPVTLEQRFFRGHTNDITCLTVDRTGTFIATGQQAAGREPFVCIWQATREPGRDNTVQVAEVGLIRTAEAEPDKVHKPYVSKQGHLFATEPKKKVASEFAVFYEHAIAAVEFSFDSRLMAACGEDENHTVALWNWRTGKLLAKSVTAKTPKQAELDSNQAMYDIVWGGRHTTEADTKYHFVTYGPSQCWFWKYNKAEKRPEFALGKARRATYGKHPKPRCTNAAVFTDMGQLVTAGAGGAGDGFIHIFDCDTAGCVASFLAHEAPSGGGTCPVMSLSYFRGDLGGYLVSGGKCGMVKYWNLDDEGAVSTTALKPKPRPKTSKSKPAAGPGGAAAAAKRRKQLAASAPTIPLFKGSQRGIGRDFKNFSGFENEEKAMSKAVNNSSEKTFVFGRKGTLHQPPPQQDPTAAIALPDEGICAIATTASGQIAVGTDLSRIYYQRKEGETMVQNGASGKAYPKRDAASSFNRIVAGHCRMAQGLGVHHASDEGGESFYVSVGDDGFIFKWSADDKLMVTRPYTLTRTIKRTGSVKRMNCRSCAISADGVLCAVGCADGSFAILRIGTGTGEVAGGFEKLLTMRLPDINSAIDVIRFSPDGMMLAMGSHNNYIDVFQLPDADPETEDLKNTATWALKDYTVKRLSRCKGHSSYIVGLDWNTGSDILQTNCAGREILYWYASTGKQIRSTFDDIEADTKWASWTCPLGFPVMGIWPDGSSGNDINAVTMSGNQKFIVTADDLGLVKLFNAPCVLNDAPYREFHGHCSFVQNCTFVEGKDKSAPRVVTIGGADCSVFQWKIDKNPDEEESHNVDLDVLGDDSEEEDGLAPGGVDDAQMRAELEKQRELERQAEERRRANAARDAAAAEAKRLQDALLAKQLAEAQDAAPSPTKMTKAQNVLKVDIKRAEGLSNNDPYVKVFWNEDKYGPTKTMKGNDVVWQEDGSSVAKTPKEGHFEFNIPPEGSSEKLNLRVEVWDKEKLHRDVFMGQHIFDAAQLYTESMETFALQKKTDGSLSQDRQKKVGGKIRVKLWIEQGVASEACGISNEALMDEVDSLEDQFKREVAPAQHLQIHVVDAAKLRAADSNMIGKATSSDPYVKVFWNDEKSGSKTKVVAKTLNPEWDNEKFQIPLPKLCIKVMDKDFLGKDNFLGQVELQGGELLVLPTEPKEYDLTYENGSSKVKYVKEESKLWLKFVEVETVRVKLIAASKLISADINLLKKNASDPYVKVLFNGEQVWKNRDAYQKDTLNPVWDEVYAEFPKPADFDAGKLTIEVWDYDSLKTDEFLGEVVIDGKDCATPITRNEPLKKNAEKKYKGPGTKKDALGNFEFQVLATDQKLVRVEVQKATALAKADFAITGGGGASDPYAIVSWNGAQLGKTPCISNELNPVWTEKNTFDLPRQRVRFEVYDHDGITEGGSDDFLGQVSFVSDELSRFKEHECYRQYPLLPRPGSKDPGDEARLGIRLHAMSKLRLQIVAGLALKRKGPFCVVKWDPEGTDPKTGAKDDHSLLAPGKAGRTSDKRMVKASRTTHNPLWKNEFFEMHLPPDAELLKTAKLSIEVYDKDFGESKKFLGTIVLDGAKILEILNAPASEKGYTAISLEKIPGRAAQEDVGGELGVAFTAHHGTMVHRELLLPIKAAQLDIRQVASEAMREQLLAQLRLGVADLADEGKWKPKLEKRVAEWEEEAKGVPDEVVVDLLGESRKKQALASPYPNGWTVPAPTIPGHQLAFTVQKAAALRDGDPFCKVFFQGGKEQKFASGKKQTKTISSTSNPEWANETVMINSEKLKVQVWDHDMANSDDFLGQVIVGEEKMAELKANGSALTFDAPLVVRAGKGDDLNEKNGGLGTINLTLDMPKRLKLHVKSAKGLANSDKGMLDKEGKPDPYVKVFWIPTKEALLQDFTEKNDKKPEKAAEKALKAAESAPILTTDKIEDMNDPVWNAMVDVAAPASGYAGYKLRMEVWDKNGKLSNDTFLGQVELEGDAIAAATSGGPPLELQKDADKKDKHNKHVQGALEFVAEASEKLRVRVNSAAGVRAADINLLGKNKSDPYAKVFWNDTELGKTASCAKTLDPDWGAAATAKKPNVFELPFSEIRLEVWDHNAITSHSRMGQVVLRADLFGDFHHLYGAREMPLLAMEGQTSDVQGTVTLALGSSRRCCLHVAHACNLAAADTGLLTSAKRAASDPYCKVLYDGEELGKRTKTISNELDPAWAAGEQQLYEMQLVDDGQEHTLELQVYDHNMAPWSDRFLGRVTLSAAELAAGIRTSDDGAPVALPAWNAAGPVGADAYRQLNLEKIKGGSRQDLVRGYVGLGLWLEPQLDVGAAADGAGAAAPAAAAAAADGSGGGGAAAASGEPSAAAAGEDETKSGAS